MKVLKYRMYGAGLSNQRVSLDMGAALSVYTKRAFVPYDFKSMEHSGRAIRGQVDRYNISDLFDIPIPMLDEQSASIPESVLSSFEFAPQRLGKHVFIDDTLQNDERFQEFLGRRDLIETDLNADYGSYDLLDFASQGNFCNVLPQFYLAEPIKRHILSTIRKIIPKSAYRNVAKAIADALRSFNTIHVRQGDFLNSKHPFDIKAPQSLLANIAGLCDRDQMLVICTDDESSPNFDLVRRRYRHCVMLESYIQESPVLKTLYEQLSFQDEAVMGVICQLVCEHAEVFAGSLRSTFTNYIHRARHERDILFVNILKRPNAVIEGGKFRVTQPDKHFSWWRTGWCMDVDPSTITWMREWPEVFD